MTGRHPWETLLKRLSPGRREAIAAGAARIRTDIEGRRGLATAPRVPLDVERLLETQELPVRAYKAG